MIRLEDGGLRRYVFESWDEGTIHGVFTRLGGTSRGAFASLNVGHTVGDDPSSVEANHQAIYRALRIRAQGVVTAHQVHGDRVAVVSPPDGGKVLPDTDGLVTDVPGLFLMLRFADCVPVFLYAPRQRAIGLAHAGWRGTVKSIAAKTVRLMASAFGCDPGEMHAGLGPAIGPCCLEVGPDVVALFNAAFESPDEFLSRPEPNGKAHLDLWLANALQLREAGVTRIEMGKVCTCCHRQEFFSHRGEKGHTGRFAGVIGLHESDAIV